MSRLAFYTVEELQEIILHSAKILEVEIDKDGALELARRSRGTPRLANRLLKRVRDFAQIKYDGRITKEVADFALNLLEVDKVGSDGSTDPHDDDPKIWRWACRIRNVSRIDRRRPGYVRRCIRTLSCSKWTDPANAKRPCCIR